MYFRVQEYKVIGKGDDGSGHGLVDIKIRLPSIYRVDYSGNVTQILHDFEDERYRSCSIDRMTVVGNYIYAQYAHYGDVPKDIYSNADYSGRLHGLMRIDLSSDEIIYVSGD